jgi:arylsulfatase A
MLMVRFLVVPILMMAFTAPAVAQQTDKRKPNIIVFLADDFGYECVAANGGKSYKTPNLDQLAQQGMRFERCYVQPLCTPTRVQLMTGKYNVRNYLNFGTLDTKSTTFANLLKRLGYATCMVGKWQLGQGLNLPKHFGFDEYCLWQHTRRPPRFANPGLEINGKEIDYRNGEYGPELINAYARDFISRKKNEPFLLYYSEMLTHGPFQPTPDSKDWDPKAMGEKINNDKKHFGDMVSYMDKMVGKLVKHLDDLKIRDNTLVLFVGDNGTGVQITSQFGNETIKGAKGSTITHGMHVPFIASWPGVIPQGKVNGDLIDSTDFLPTMCDAANAKIEEKIDGRSFLPQLRGEKGTPREWFYCWYARDGGAEATHEFAATKQYKLYRNGSLYDYQKDVMEKTPLTNLNAEDVAAQKMLQTALEQYKDARPAEYKTPGKKKKAKD